MFGLSAFTHRYRLRAVVAGIVLAAAACNDEPAAPTEIAAAPADSIATPPADTAATPPADSTVPPPGDSTVAPPDSSAPPDSTVTPDDSLPADSAGVGEAILTHPGIAFGTFEIPNTYMNAVHTGTLHGGGLMPTNVLSRLAAIRAKGGRAVLKLSMGRDYYVQNPDGTFSLTKWKALVDRYKSVNLTPYINDGTILGHYLLDEPSRTERWGGKIVSHATIEAMAKHSKQNWPGMTTFVRSAPTWLAQGSITYVYLDAGWAQYASYKGDAAKYITAEVAAAKGRGLGLVVGLNVLDGGNGSSRIAGWKSGMYAMSASELRSYGTTLLNQSHACAFYMWQHDIPYYGRADIRSAMTELSAKAKSHVRTSCK